MKVLLLQDVKSQGKKDQVIEVSEGYARNFLFPKKLAIPADAKAINDAKNRQSSADHKKALEKEAAQKLASSLENAYVKLTADTAKDISEGLKAQHGIDIDKRKIVLDAPIKAFGTYKIDAKLYPDVVGKITVVVTEK